MNRTEELKQQIQNLSREELAELRDWFWDQDSKAWDAQIEADAKSGNLDPLLILSPEERAVLDKALDAYEADRNSGRLSEDVIAEIRASFEPQAATRLAVALRAIDARGWLETLQRRYRDLIEGKVRGIPAPLVFERLRARFRR